MVFRNGFFYLSNMFPCPVTLEVDGQTLTFPCAESAFQAMKCPPQAKYFANGPENKHLDGYKAKKAGRNLPLRSDWEQVKIRIMAEVLAAKFTQNPELEKKLCSIQSAITEDNTWHDTFWGVCEGKGKNWLGRILMQIRDFPPSQNYTPEYWLKNLGVDTEV